MSGAGSVKLDRRAFRRGVFRQFGRVSKGIVKAGHMLTKVGA